MIVLTKKICVCYGAIQEILKKLEKKNKTGLNRHSRTDTILDETLVACAEMEMPELEEGISRGGLRVNFIQYIHWRYWHKTKNGLEIAVVETNR